MVTRFLFGMMKKVFWNYIVAVAHSGYTKTSELYILR